jgi:hypothetical protein
MCIYLLMRLRVSYARVCFVFKLLCAVMHCIVYVQHHCPSCPFTCVVVSMVAAQGHDHSLRYLSLYDNRYLRYFSGHVDRVTSLCLSPKMDQFMSSSMVPTPSHFLRPLFPPLPFYISPPVTAVLLPVHLHLPDSRSSVQSGQIGAHVGPAQPPLPGRPSGPQCSAHSSL